MAIEFSGTTPAYTELLQKELENSRDLARAAYQKYVPQEGLERTAPFSPLQEQSFKVAEQMGADQQPGGYFSQLYDQARGSINNALGQDVKPYIDRATGPTDINEFYNPYQERVIRNLESEGARNLRENILPNINTRFIGAGQYGSTGHQDLTNRAIRDTVEAASKARATAQHEGFNTSLKAALDKQGNNFQAGQLAGKDIDRQMLGGEALQNLAGSRQTGGIRNIGVLGQIGGQQQQQQQNISNTAYQNWQQQANHPYQKQSWLTEQIRGLPQQTQVYPGAVPPTPPMQPQASPYAQMGSLLLGATGAFNQRPQGYAHGGEVKKLTHHRHYAQGGSLSPIQQGANHAIETAELQSMRGQANKLAQPNVDPFWASIARTGFNMAANRQPGVLARLGEAAGAGLTEYHSQLKNQDDRGMQSAKIMEVIDNTRRLQAERNRTHQFETDKFGETKRQFGMTHGLEKQKFAYEKYLYEKGLKGPNASTKTSAQLNAERKANQEQLKEWGTIVSKGPEALKLLKDIDVLNEKIQTPGYESFLSEYAATKPISNLLKSRRAGKEDVELMDSLSNRLVANKIAKIPGKGNTVSHQNTIKSTKMSADKPYNTNKQLGKDEAYGEKKDIAEATFGINMFNKYKNPVTGIPLFNTAEIKKAFSEYQTEKRDWEETHEAAIPFPKTPESYLDGEHVDINNSNISLDEKSVEDQAIMSGIANLIG